MADLANFAAINKCTQGPLSQELTVSGDPYTRVSYGGCDAPRDSEVVLVVVPNGTHHPFLPNPGFSTAADNFDSAKIACEFLFDYERDGSVIKRTAWASPSPDYGAAVHGAASVRYITLEQLRSV
jgi:poly(3-hydroxybutyrate) depolymerase